MDCPRCGSKNVLELDNLHSLWACGNCGFQGDGSVFDDICPECRRRPAGAKRGLCDQCRFLYDPCYSISDYEEAYARRLL